MLVLGDLHYDTLRLMFKILAIDKTVPIVATIISIPTSLIQGRIDAAFRFHLIPLADNDVAFIRIFHLSRSSSDGGMFWVW